MTERTELLAGLRRRIRRTAGPLVRGSRRVALLDFPAHGNVGDSAIWLGALAFLRDLGLGEPAYTCERATFDPGALRRRVGDGPILLSGGGNLGDLYPCHQAFREEVIRRFPRNPIVQLPQSIWFGERRARERARRVFDAHPRLTILARDRASLERARRHFSVSSALCPDMAFALDGLRRTGEPEHDRLWLLRTGPEAVDPPVGPPEGARVRDWITDEPSVPRWLHGRLRALGRPEGRPGRSLLLRATALTYEPLARRRLRRGIRLLSSAREVVTNRLHGHVLCLLLGIPHLLADNSNGKVGAFHRTWTWECDSVGWLGGTAGGRPGRADGGRPDRAGGDPAAAPEG